MRVLCTGGAGYIGSHTLRLLVERGDHVVVVDDLSNGVAARVGGLPVHRLDLADPAAIAPLTELLRTERIDAVVHFAARKRVDESVARPAWYYRQNVGALAVVLEAMEAAGVHRIVFSSSAAVYGATEGHGIAETDATEPVNPYGATKLVGEQLVAAATHAFPLRAASLRYFNVAGAGWPELGDTAVLNLVPMVFERIDAGEAPVIFGDDYPTPDGTCVRDFVHVLDLAEAHVAMLGHLEAAEPGHVIVNVGTGTGYSVREMVEAIRRTAGFDVPPVVRQRRAGDPASVVADPSGIRALTGWSARLGLDDIVQSAWDSHLLFR
ncbi:MAG: UDP-glucose 4-epimerase GalE [Microbacterium sp.]